MKVTVEFEVKNQTDLQTALEGLKGTLPDAVAEEPDPKKPEPDKPKLAPEKPKKAPKKKEDKPAEQKAITLEEVRAVLAKLSQAGKQAEVKNLITKYKAKKLSDIPADQYPALLQEAESL